MWAFEVKQVITEGEDIGVQKGWTSSSGKKRNLSSRRMPRCMRVIIEGPGPEGRTCSYRRPKGRGGKDVRELEDKTFGVAFLKEGVS